MKQFVMTKNSIPVIYTDADTYEGVKRIAGKVSADLEMVFGSGDRKKAQPVADFTADVKKGCFVPAEGSGDKASKYAFFVMTDGVGIPAGESFAEESKLGKVLKSGLKKIHGKRECYFWKMVNNPCEGIETAIVIVGSDKRGTIYGLFHLSDLLGVSPWYYWADVTPKKCEQMVFDKSVEMVSKEPSVRFRGFFINDEWPSFGNWTFEKYNGFTAQMYDTVFELLLRMKGNYLWPAMWSSSFTLDGPGPDSAILADLYGVVMGTSHHEPCLRHSEEWDLVKGPKSVYGQDWNYYKNKEGLLKYWEDGLKRSSKWENVITIGMRGERDSSMLGENSTLKENIDLLKDIISNQRRLIREIVPNASEVPLMLALYKEVEAYFYGDEEAEGLIDWDGLDDVILLLCEDNYGNMRTLPTKKMREHKGGFGMYYHFDYHGGPISYEWVNSSPISKTWEQMTTAYEYGIRDLWIVNVGDLKPQEYPLSFFMELAYDYEKYGISARNMTHQYTKKWVADTFGRYLTEAEIMQTIALLEGYVRLNGYRRPEALNCFTYHPTNFNEAAQIFREAQEMYDCANRMMSVMKEEEPQIADAFAQLIWFPVCASANVIRMQILAGWNRMYVQNGDRDSANACARLVGACIRKDRELTESYHGIHEGKWNGMASSKHVGFIHWNDEGSDYPVCLMWNEENGKFEEVDSKTAEEYAKEEGMPGADEMDMSIVVPEPENEPRTTEDTDKLKKKLPKKTYLGTADGDNYYICIEACGFSGKEAGDKAEWEHLTDYGKTDSGMKVFPITKSFKRGKGPYMEYSFYSPKKCDYTMEIIMAPTNGHTKTDRQFFGISVNDGKVKSVASLPEKFDAGNPGYGLWCIGVLDNERKVTEVIPAKKGVNTFRIYGEDAGVVMERFVLWMDYENRKKSYFGPRESYFT